MVKLTPQQQADFVHSRPAVFQPVKGAWGRRGSTRVCLRAATGTSLMEALVMAWRNAAPKRVPGPFEDE